MNLYKKQLPNYLYFVLVTIMASILFINIYLFGNIFESRRKIEIAEKVIENCNNIDSSDIKTIINKSNDTIYFSVLKVYYIDSTYNIERFSFQSTMNVDELMMLPNEELDFKKHLDNLKINKVQFFVADYCKEEDCLQHTVVFRSFQDIRENSGIIEIR